jgi:hypothetical protein
MKNMKMIDAELEPIGMIKYVTVWADSGENYPCEYMEKDWGDWKDDFRMG